MASDLNTDATALAQVYGLFDQGMMQAFEADDPRCFQLAEENLMLADLPTVYRARALIILATKPSPHSRARATEAVRLLNEDVRQECILYQCAYPSVQYETACEVLEAIERRRYQWADLDQTMDPVPASITQATRVKTPSPRANQSRQQSGAELRQSLRPLPQDGTGKSPELQKQTVQAVSEEYDRLSLRDAPEGLLLRQGIITPPTSPVKSAGRRGAHDNHVEQSLASRRRSSRTSKRATANIAKTPGLLARRDTKFLRSKSVPANSRGHSNGTAIVATRPRRGSDPASARLLSEIYPSGIIATNTTPANTPHGALPFTPITGITRQNILRTPLSIKRLYGSLETGADESLD